MTKVASLNGSEIASFIKERQASSVRSMAVQPQLAIIRTDTSQVTDLYLRIKQAYAETIGARVEVFQTTENEAGGIIEDLNNRKDVHGIIVQLPLGDPSRTDELLDKIVALKDVDGLSSKSVYDTPTPIAILWLLASYNIDLRGKRVAVIGQGRLVGAPLVKMLTNSGVDVSSADVATNNLEAICLGSQIVISATGKAGLITATMIPEGAVVIDAGTSSENGEVVGDVADDVRLREDVAITPKIGGVGPLTVAALYENLLLATRNQMNE